MEIEISYIDENMTFFSCMNILFMAEEKEVLENINPKRCKK